MIDKEPQIFEELYAREIKTEKEFFMIVAAVHLSQGIESGWAWDQEGKELIWSMVIEWLGERKTYCMDEAMANRLMKELDCCPLSQEYRDFVKPIFDDKPTERPKKDDKYIKVNAPTTWRVQ